MTGGGAIAAGRVVDGVIFDMDGVIVDSEHLWGRSWGAFAERHGRAWSEADSVTLQGMSVPEWAVALAALVGRPELADQARLQCVDHYVAAIESGEGPPLDGARRLVEEIARRCRIALASSAPRRGIDAALRRDRIDGLFTATVSSEEVPRGKPFPDVYLEAARRLGLGPSHGAAVEDSGNGIRAAVAAGLAVVALPNQAFPPPPDALALAEYVAADHDDVLDFLLPRLPRQ
ncbi:MAG TPA: HAD family phosphatase [Pseudonocardia sp.]|nr:HAD family phosphatase [Pseudonocardia sp.]